MGLDTTHDCWHGPYSTFMAWRTAIARLAGIDLNEMEGFGGSRAWSELPASALHLLLNHSDCDGTLAASDCNAIADALAALPPLADSRMRDKTEFFIAGLRDAAAKGEGVEFH